MTAHKFTIDDREFKALQDGTKTRHRIRIDIDEPNVEGPSSIASPIATGDIIEFSSPSGETIEVEVFDPKVEKIADVEGDDAVKEGWQYVNPPASFPDETTSDEIYAIGCWIGLSTEWSERYGADAVIANPWSVGFEVRALEHAPAPR